LNLRGAVTALMSGVFQGRMLETFLVESWMEHLRQDERITNADRVVQDAVDSFQQNGERKITHLVAAEP
jgi:Transmembrane secretion effector